MASRRRLKYLVGGKHEDDGIIENVSRATAATALRKAWQLVKDGYTDVRICTPRGQVVLPDELNRLDKKETDMTKGERRGNREARKPKKEKIKVIAAAPSQKAVTSQPSLFPGKRK
jgi:ribosomal protein L19E